MLVTCKNEEDPIKMILSPGNSKNKGSLDCFLLNFNYFNFVNFMSIFGSFSLISNL